MEHCPLCGTDTPCTTIGDKRPPVYRCNECWIQWDPNRSWAWQPRAKFNPSELARKGIVLDEQHT